MKQQNKNLCSEKALQRYESDIVAMLFCFASNEQTDQKIFLLSYQTATKQVARMMI